MKRGKKKFGKLRALARKRFYDRHALIGHLQWHHMMKADNARRQARTGRSFWVSWSGCDYWWDAKAWGWWDVKWKFTRDKTGLPCPVCRQAVRNLVPGNRG